jgi:hypothetical protein
VPSARPDSDDRWVHQQTNHAPENWQSPVYEGPYRSSTLVTPRCMSGAGRDRYGCLGRRDQRGVGADRGVEAENRDLREANEILAGRPGLAITSGRNSGPTTDHAGRIETHLNGQPWTPARSRPRSTTVEARSGGQGSRVQISPASRFLCCSANGATPRGGSSRGVPNRTSGGSWHT